MTVTVEDMRSKLFSLDTARAALANTEPLTSAALDPDSTSFHLNDWNLDQVLVESMGDTDTVAATVRLGSAEFPLTKEALLEATSAVGLSKAFVTRTPGTLIEPLLNHCIQQGTRDMKLLITRGVGAAFTRATINPFSNLLLLDNMLEGVRDRFGDTEILVDYKFNHTLAATNLRLVLPESQRILEHTGTANDVWSTGIQLTNSLIGKKQTSIEGYLFRWTCTNGATTTQVSSGPWSRKSGGQGDEVYVWARDAVDAVLGGLEGALDQVQHLVDVPVGGAVADILLDAFNTYKIPAAERDMITANMLNTEEALNMYTVMQAITQVANTPDLESSHVDRLLAAGGDLAHTVASRCDSCHRRI